MIKIFDLISGHIEEVYSYIEKLETFECWQLGKDYQSQVERMMSRGGPMSHIGAITYQGRDKSGSVVIHAAFVAITTSNTFLNDK